MSNNHSTVIVSQIHAAIRDQIMDRFSSFTWFLLHTVLVVTIMAVIVKQHIYKTIRDGILFVNFACPGYFFGWIISYPLCWKFFNVAATHQLRTTALSHHHCFTWAKTLYVSFFFFFFAVTPFFMVFYEFSMIVLNISIVCWLFIFRVFFSSVLLFQVDGRRVSMSSFMQYFFLYFGSNRHCQIIIVFFLPQVTAHSDVNCKSFWTPWLNFALLQMQPPISKSLWVSFVRRRQMQPVKCAFVRVFEMRFLCLNMAFIRMTSSFK